MSELAAMETVEQLKGAPEGHGEAVAKLVISALAQASIVSWKKWQP